MDWITAKGPKFGQAEVFIDDLEQGTYNLNQTSTQWKFPISFTGLTPGTHTIKVRPLGDAAVVVDAFKGRIIAMGNSQELGASPALEETSWWPLLLSLQAVRQSLSLGQ